MTPLLDLEARVLGAAIQRSELIPDDLEPGDFFDLKHQLVFRALRNLQAAGVAIDVAAVGDRIYDDGNENALDVHGEGNGAAYLFLENLIDNSPKGRLLSSEWFAERVGTIRAAKRNRDAKLNEANGTSVVKRWKLATELVDEIWSRKDDPWIALRLADDQLCRVRAGGIVVIIGGSGSGKSSLVSNILIEHARDIGPAIAVSIELPADEFAGRVVGIKCDASWEDVLRGEVPREHIVNALNMPRLYVLERKNATLENLRACIDAARQEHPDQPILVAIDYAQLIQSKEKEVRLRVSDAFERIDDVAREKRVVTIAVSQMSRAGAKLARDGERIGADAADLGAESAAIERFATATLTIGKKGEPREDGSCAVELSLGKGRMSGGDVVYPMSYWGKSGLWRIAGTAQRAAEVREQRTTERQGAKLEQLKHAIADLIGTSSTPLYTSDIRERLSARKADVLLAIKSLREEGRLIDVQGRRKGGGYPVWVPARVENNEQ